ncbi:MAG: putative molybdenum carrier protein [Deltaproteobacteria bacterium]|nr:putative molybdenum carrier protein [Deltaproteobacteria bacterium]
MIRKIISGGQIGADQAALDVAIKLGFPHGGWIQKGRKTQSGILPAKYQLKELPTAGYKRRIEQNVIDSDGTVIISHGEPTGGAEYSRKMADKHRRPCLHVGLKESSTFVIASKINTWVLENIIEVLNVTGSRASEDSTVYKDTMDIVEGSILLGLVEAKPGEPVSDEHPSDYLDKGLIPPITVDGAVVKLISEMHLHDRVQLANLKREELAQLDVSLGRYIKDQLLRNGVNRLLFESCMTASGKVLLNESDASLVIIEKLWEKLKETHRLRILK